MKRGLKNILIITPTEPNVKGGEAETGMLLAAFTLDVRIRRCYSGMRSAK